MCSDDTPIEMSMCWKPTTSGTYKAGVRYTFDITPGPGKTQLSLARVREQFMKMEESSLIEEPDWDLWLDLTRTLLFGDAQHAAECRVCPASNLALGFDLAGNRVKGKVYWFMPGCLSYDAHLDLLDEFFERLVSDYGAEGIRRWRTLRKFATNQDKKVHFGIVSMDSSKGGARVKLYTQIDTAPGTDLRGVFSIMSMGGMIPISPKLLSAAEKVWSSFTERGVAHPSFVHLYFDIILSVTNEENVISSKINIPIHDTSLTDTEASRILVDSLGVEEMKRFLECVHPIASFDHALSLSYRPFQDSDLPRGHFT